MKFEFPITPKSAQQFLIGLIAVEIFFVAVYWADYVLGQPFWRINHLFNLDKEANIPAWFSTIQLFIIGLIALGVAFSKGYKTPPSKLSVITFGIGFIYLSMDEAAVIHEKITYIFHNHPWVPYFDGPHGIWIVVYGALALILIGIFHKDIYAVFKHFRQEALIFVAGIVVYLAGAAGAETITFFHIDKSNMFVYVIEVILEEFLEMAGASVLLYSVLLLAIKKTKA